MTSRVFGFVLIENFFFHEIKNKLKLRREASVCTIYLFVCIKMNFGLIFGAQYVKILFHSNYQLKPDICSLLLYKLEKKAFASFLLLFYPKIEMYS